MLHQLATSERILSIGLFPMNKRPTIHSVAKEAGVSVSTVSQVLRGVGRISDDTRRKVQKAAKKLDFVRDRRAMAMRSGETRDVGLLIHRIANPFNAEVVAGASSYLQEKGYLLFVLDAEDDVELQGEVLAHLDWRFGGRPVVDSGNRDNRGNDRLDSTEQPGNHHLAAYAS